VTSYLQHDYLLDILLMWQR